MKELIPKIKKLEVVKPPVSNNPRDAIIFSILSNHKKTYPWIMNYFVQVYACSYIYNNCFYYYFDYIDLDYWHICPYLMKQYIHKDTIYMGYENISDFIIHNIHLDNYIVLPIDWSYIKAYNHPEKYYHELFIYGYNQEEKTFNIADFFRINSDNDHSFDFGTCTFDEIELASKATSVFDKYNWVNIVTLLKLDFERKHKPDHICCTNNDFDISILIQLLEDYKNGYNSETRFRITQKINDPYECRAGGIAIYKILLDYLDWYLKGSEILSSKGFYILFSHKKLMVLRMEFLIDLYKDERLKDLLSDFIEIQDIAQKILNIVIKYNIKKKDISGIMTELLNRIKEKEVVAYSRLIDILKDINKFN